mmetsp:Transcript_8820/g.12280  ORF Transcript_8820/g.12280 Transcript_8820/m.12280 type:complete len:283 (-) Transcript_8820:438-1286(-)
MATMTMTMTMTEAVTPKMTSPLKMSVTTESTKKISSEMEHVSESARQRTLRRGKWTTEEERYVQKVVDDFNNGLLDAPAGTTLRNYLSEKLECDPMRITKKFTKENSIGKRVFHPVSIDDENEKVFIQKVRAETAELEAQWRRKLQAQAREQADALNAKRKVDASSVVDASHHHHHLNKRRRLEPADARKCASWLQMARTLLDDDIVPPSPSIIPQIDHALDSGHQFHDHLISRQNYAYHAQVDKEEVDHITADKEDKEATHLLVDFLRSAQRTLCSTAGKN